jgi:hypothetical protein
MLVAFAVQWLETRFAPADTGRDREG